MSWLPRSTLGTILAALYALVAALAVVADRRPGGGGGWISLNGIGSFLITLPVSALGERLGHRPDYRRNLDMAFAIGVCAALVYLLGCGLEWLVHQLLRRGGA